MKKFYVTPITPNHVFEEYMAHRNVVISYLRPDNYKLAVEHCQKIIFDNGAYTFFRKGIASNFETFYKFLEDKKFNYFFIPDVINGSETENDLLISQCPKEFLNKGIPVFHIHESNDRLIELMKRFNYIAFGSSGEFWKIGTDKWLNRIHQLMKIVCDPDGFPKIKIHMLRCLNAKIFTKFPFYSGDSSNFARNHSRDGAGNIIDNIESFNSPEKYDFDNFNHFYQMTLSDFQVD